MHNSAYKKLWCATQIEFGKAMASLFHMQDPSEDQNFALKVANGKVGELFFTTFRYMPGFVRDVLWMLEPGVVEVRHLSKTFFEAFS